MTTQKKSVKVTKIYIVVNGAGVEISRHKSLKIARAAANWIGGTVQCYRTESQVN